MNTVDNVFIGYDSSEDEAYQVCKFSLEHFSSKQINITPLKKDNLIKSGIYSNAEHGTVSTEFAFTRFLVPYLSNYSGFSIFVDCDFIFLDDINKVLNYITDKALYVVQHNYVPKTSTKMEGKIQTVFPRKNWSSFMLFDCNHSAIKNLTPDVVNKSSGEYLHRFKWLSDDLIGKLPVEFNFLVGYYDKNILPVGVHFTDGGPWLQSYENVDFSDKYFELKKMMSKKI